MWLSRFSIGKVYASEVWPQVSTIANQMLQGITPNTTCFHNGQCNAARDHTTNHPRRVATRCPQLPIKCCKGSHQTPLASTMANVMLQGITPQTTQEGWPTGSTIAMPMLQGITKTTHKQSGQTQSYPKKTGQLVGQLPSQCCKGSLQKSSLEEWPLGDQNPTTQCSWPTSVANLFPHLPMQCCKGSQQRPLQQKWSQQRLPPKKHSVFHNCHSNVVRDSIHL